MDLQEPAGNQQAIAQPANTLRQRKNTENATTQQLLLPATIFSSIYTEAPRAYAESPRAMETIQSTPMPIHRDKIITQPKRRTYPIFIAYLPDITVETLTNLLDMRNRHIILPQAIRYSLLLHINIDKDEEAQGTQVLSFNPLLEKDTNLKLHFIANLLNFIAEHKKQTQQLPTNDMIREHIQEETKNFTIISFDETNNLLTYFQIPIARIAINTITPEVIQELNILFEQLRKEELQDKKNKEMLQIQ
jgi:hypothetical protein